MSESTGVATCDHCGGPDRDGYPLAICGTSDPDITDGCKGEFVVCHSCHLRSEAFTAAKKWHKGHECTHAADVAALRAEVERLKRVEVVLNDLLDTKGGLLDRANNREVALITKLQMLGLSEAQIAMGLQP